jgi:hypothetical protein
MYLARLKQKHRVATLLDIVDEAINPNKAPQKDAAAPNRAACAAGQPAQQASATDEHNAAFYASLPQGRRRPI